MRKGICTSRPDSFCYVTYGDDLAGEGLYGVLSWSFGEQDRLAERAGIADFDTHATSGIPVVVDNVDGVRPVYLPKELMGELNLVVLGDFNDLFVEVEPRRIDDDPSVRQLLGYALRGPVELGAAADRQRSDHCQIDHEEASRA